MTNLIIIYFLHNVILTIQHADLYMMDQEVLVSLSPAVSTVICVKAADDASYLWLKLRRCSWLP